MVSAEPPSQQLGRDVASTNDEADIDDSIATGNPLIDGLLTEYHWAGYPRTFFAYAIPDSETDYEDTRDPHESPHFLL